MQFKELVDNVIETEARECGTDVSSGEVVELRGLILQRVFDVRDVRDVEQREVANVDWQKVVIRSALEEFLSSSIKRNVLEKLRRAK